MTDEVRYDTADEADVIRGEARETDASADEVPQGLGCHSGSEMKKAAGIANAELLEKFAKDYPQGPHDKPQIDVPGLWHPCASACGCAGWRRFSRARPAASMA